MCRAVRGPVVPRKSRLRFCGPGRLKDMLPRYCSRLGVLPALLFTGLAPLSAQTTIQIVADNDFAVFAGTTTAVTRVIYQNDAGWSSQIAAASSFTFALQSGEDTFYVLAMGGGGQENISGRINGVNLVAVHDADSTEGAMSSNLASFLSGYSSRLGEVSNGTYVATVEEVQTALSSLSWFLPAIVSGQTVINSNPHAFDAGRGYNVGFGVADSTAVLFRFSAESVGVPVTPVPEPSAYAALAGVAVLGFAAWRRRRATTQPSAARPRSAA